MYAKEVLYQLVLRSLTKTRRLTTMVKKDITIINKLGLHARAAAKFVQTASRFSSDIHVSLNGKNVNGKSIMGIMMLAAARGTQIEISTDGSDQEQALSELEALILDRFGESE